MTRERSLVRALGSTVAGVALVASLAGCGGQPTQPGETSSSSSPAATASPNSSTYNATLPGGAVVNIVLPAVPAPDPALESLRHDAGIKRALYAKISIDNSRGSKPVSVKRLVLTGEDGAVYRLDALPGVVEGWAARPADQGGWRTASGDPLDAARAEDLNDRVAALAGKYTGDVPVGGRGEEIVVGDLDGIPRSFARMELVPSMGDEEESPVQPSPDDRGGQDMSRPAAPQAPEVPARDDPSADFGNDPSPEETEDSAPTPEVTLGPEEPPQQPEPSERPAPEDEPAPDPITVDPEAVTAPRPALPTGHVSPVENIEAVEGVPVPDLVGQRVVMDSVPAGTSAG